MSTGGPIRARPAMAEPRPARRQHSCARELRPHDPGRRSRPRRWSSESTAPADSGRPLAGGPERRATELFEQSAGPRTWSNAATCLTRSDTFCRRSKRRERRSRRLWTIAIPRRRQPEPDGAGRAHGSLVEDMLTTSARASSSAATAISPRRLKSSTTGRGQQISESFRAIVDDFEQRRERLLSERQRAEFDGARDHARPGPVGLASAAGAALGAFFMSAALDRGIARAHRALLAEETRVRKDAQAILVQTQKMELIGLLAGGVATTSTIC